jgi:hypothetical protein
LAIPVNHIVPINRVRTDRTTPAGDSRPQTYSFKELLSQTLNEKGQEQSNGGPPLSKEQLIDIINNVKAQMDARLIRALSFDSGENVEAAYLGLIDRLIIPTPESSNNYHETQNNDVSNHDVLSPGSSNSIDTIIQQAAQAHDVDPDLIKSVIKVESNFKSNSTSPKGAMGLMQLMPETAKELGVQNAYNPSENIWAGTRYIKMLLKRYEGNVPLALAAYNWGMGNLEKKSGQMPAETRHYVSAVTRYYEQQKV